MSIEDEDRLTEHMRVWLRDSNRIATIVSPSLTLCVPQVSVDVLVFFFFCRWPTRNWVSLTRWCRSSTVQTPFRKYVATSPLHRDLYVQEGIMSAIRDFRSSARLRCWRTSTRINSLDTVLGTALNLSLKMCHDASWRSRGRLGALRLCRLSRPDRVVGIVVDLLSFL